MSLAVLVYFSLALFLLGLAAKVFSWLLTGPGFHARSTLFAERLWAAVAGVFGTVFSRKIVTLVWTFVADVLFQHKILKESVLRWVMHMLIFYGFMFLLIFHALGRWTTAGWFNPDYAYLNPFLFLRDLAGVAALVGVCIAIWRRTGGRVPRFKTNGQDIYAIALVLLILCSGIALEGAKISSYSTFMYMAQDYGGLDPDGDEDTIHALAAFWHDSYGLSAPDLGEVDEDVLAEGRDTNDAYCASCHVSNKWAPAGFITAKIISPVAGPLDRIGFVNFLYWLHILLCLAGLALLPFTKMFHMFTTPLSLLMGAAMDEDSRPANVATRQALELDACTHCGTCSLNCSAMMGYHAKGNPYILPSEKVQLLKKVVWGRHLDEEKASALAEGMLMCTNCDRCTVVCPSGITLKTLWLTSREEVIHEAPAQPLMLSPFTWHRALNKPLLGEDEAAYDAPRELAQEALAGRFEALMNPEAEVSLTDAHNDLADDTFASCFGCQTCTTVCPVVREHENPAATLGLVPHQIMCSLALGLDEMASGANMIWECVTCYQCQENCPQHVDVADLLYGLKNLASGNAAAKKAGNR